jgi:ketosteroid isomerase-like protein
MANKSSENELLQHEKQYWQALKDKDFDTCDRLTDDPCLISGPHGAHRIGKDKFREIMKSGKTTILEFEFKDSEVRMLSDDVGIVAYTVHEKVSVDGKEITLDASDSSTWIRKNGKWVCALHTEAPIGDPYGRDKKQAA